VVAASRVAKNIYTTFYIYKTMFKETLTAINRPGQKFVQMCFSTLDNSGCKTEEREEEKEKEKKKKVVKAAAAVGSFT
jgi:hypothetical protein